MRRRVVRWQMDRGPTTRTRRLDARRSAGDARRSNWSRSSWPTAPPGRRDAGRPPAGDRPKSTRHRSGDPGRPRQRALAGRAVAPRRPRRRDPGRGGRRPRRHDRRALAARSDRRDRELRPRVCRSTPCRSRPRSTAWWSPARSCNPVTGECSTPRAAAVRWLGRQRLHGPRDGPARARGASATGFGYDARTARSRRRRSLAALLLPRSATSGGSGAASLDLCFVAAGRLDAYFEAGLNPWDYAAGALIATEAGCAGQRCAVAAARHPVRPWQPAGPERAAVRRAAEYRRGRGARRLSRRCGAEPLSAARRTATELGSRRARSVPGSPGPWSARCVRPGGEATVTNFVPSETTSLESVSAWYCTSLAPGK